jgi:hypothetical protein
MQLAELQRAFQEHVLREGDEIAGQINASAEMPVAMRLDVYSEAYFARLTEALAASYPRLQSLIGEEAFAILGRHYIQQYPSTNFSVRWFGDRLGVMLRTHPDYRDQSWLAELAQWEWALAEAFDAADTPPLTLDALASVAPSQWPSLQFQCHPSLQRLLLHWNTAALFKALADDLEAPAAAALENPQHWIIWREDLITRYRELADDEALALVTVCAGGTFADMCEALCEHHDPEVVPVTAAGMLKGWIAAQMIAAFF